MEYIYYLICPIDNVVKYVGKTKNVKRRYNTHVKKLDKGNTLKKQWLLKLFEKNLMPICKVVEECDSNARDREQYHVDLNYDTILNIHNPSKGVKSIKKNINYGVQ